jgi:hypothetical protein
LTFGSSCLMGSYCHPILKPLCLLSIFLHFLESLSRLQFHTYPNFSLTDSRTGRVHFQCSLTYKYPPASAIYKSTCGLLHHPLFYVTHYALKSSDQYNFTIGASRLLGNPCHPILNPIRLLSTTISCNLFHGSSGWRV